MENKLSFVKPTTAEQKIIDMYNKLICNQYKEAIMNRHLKTIAYPCVHCTKKEYEELIRDKLLEWGYKTDHISSDFSYFDTVVTNCTGVFGLVTNARFNSTDCSRYLCYSISEFLKAAKEKAIEEGLYKEKFGNTALQAAIKNNLNMQITSKFKVGDTVRVKHRKGEMSDYRIFYTDEMSKLVGDVFKVVAVLPLSSTKSWEYNKTPFSFTKKYKYDEEPFYYILEDNAYYWPSEALELVKFNMVNPYAEFKLEEKETSKKVELKVVVKKHNKLSTYLNKKLFNILK